MRSVKHYNQDYYGGALVMLVGLATFFGGMHYQIGTLQRMGPGFFPTAIGVILTAIGLLIAVSARPGTSSAENHVRVRAPDLRGALCILGGLGAFILLGDHFGLVPATFAAVFIAAVGDRQNTLKDAALLAIGMVVLAVVLFHWALQLQIELFQWS